MSKKTKGAISGIFLVLAIILVIVIIVVFVVLKISATKKTNTTPSASSTAQPTNVPVQGTSYDATVGDVKFSFQSATDLGNTLTNSDPRFPQTLTTTDKFIKVIVGAQDQGKFNIMQGAWDVGDIVDSNGRHFVSINDKAYSFLPTQNACGNLLKPDFQPTSCVKLYEVSKESTNLTVEVNAIPPNTSKKKEAFIGLIVN